MVEPFKHFDSHYCNMMLLMMLVVSVAHFLESRGMIEDALEVAIDPDYIFDLAIQLGKLDVAKSIAIELQSEQQLGELAIIVEADTTFKDEDDY
ncbi:Coatomer subunit beta'-3 [Glycine max]|nr:Coatomer subunit beta'-3 [Glycine max]